jgi:phosphotransferase system HPr (HPr) family protein
MIRKEIKLLGHERLQSRPAALFVQEACKYASRILIEQGGKTANAKSMMGVLSLNMPTKGAIALVIDGADEKMAMEAISPLLDGLFTVIA